MFNSMLLLKGVKGCGVKQTWLLMENKSILCLRCQMTVLNVSMHMDCLCFAAFPQVIMYAGKCTKAICFQQLPEHRCCSTDGFYSRRSVALNPSLSKPD